MAMAISSPSLGSLGGTLSSATRLQACSRVLLRVRHQPSCRLLAHRLGHKQRSRAAAVAAEDAEGTQGPQGEDSAAGAADPTADTTVATAAAEESNAATEAAGEDGGQAGADEQTEQPKKSRPNYPKGLRLYETMAVLRPDITEEQRHALSQRYEEAIIAAGGMDVEVFNRGIMPLAYAIVRRNTRGEKNTYVDGIYYMFTYATQPSSQAALEKRFQMDDDIIRSMTFKRS